MYTSFNSPITPTPSNPNYTPLSSIRPKSYNLKPSNDREGLKNHTVSSLYNMDNYESGMYISPEKRMTESMKKRFDRMSQPVSQSQAVPASLGKATSTHPSSGVGSSAASPIQSITYDQHQQLAIKFFALFMTLYTLQANGLVSFFLVLLPNNVAYCARIALYLLYAYFTVNFGVSIYSLYAKRALVKGHNQP